MANVDADLALSKHRRAQLPKLLEQQVEDAIEIKDEDENG
jgi:hypothetical protein